MTFDEAGQCKEKVNLRRIILKNMIKITDHKDLSIYPVLRISRKCVRNKETNPIETLEIHV